MFSTRQVKVSFFDEVLAVTRTKRLLPPLSYVNEDVMPHISHLASELDC